MERAGAGFNRASVDIELWPAGARGKGKGGASYAPLATSEELSPVSPPRRTISMSAREAGHWRAIPLVKLLTITTAAGIVPTAYVSICGVRGACHGISASMVCRTSSDFVKGYDCAYT